MLLRTGGPYREVGEDYFTASSKDRVKDQLLRRLKRMGYEVSVNEPALPSTVA